MHWARERYADVRVIMLAYGQPHRDAELTCGGLAADRLGLRKTRLALADAMHLHTGLLGDVRAHDAARTGVNPAFVPGRNVIFLALAAAHACAWWPNGNIDLVIGACIEDAAAFPDCRPNVLSQTGMLLRQACARQIEVVAPFAASDKATILAEFVRNPAALRDLQMSWSCYRGERSGPCGTCTACVVRAAAFARAGIDDLSAHPDMFGGDPGREHRP
jgi:7-cyano-7-deazaguanine synthase